MPSRLAAAVLTSLVAACTSIGPGTVPHDRIDYASSIGNSWKEQTLLNIVKLRYADMPIFLEVAQVIAGYQLQSALSGSFTLGLVRKLSNRLLIELYIGLQPSFHTIYCGSDRYRTDPREIFGGGALS